MPIQNIIPLLDEEFILKLMLTGDFGTGKSVFGASCPQPIFVFDWDRKIQSYRSVKDITFATYPISATGWVEFEKDFRVVIKDAMEGKYKTVIGDSVSGLMALAMARAMQLDPKRSHAEGPVWNVHYQIVRNLMEPKLRALLNVPCNLLVTTHLALQIDQETGAILGAEPLITGQLSTLIPGAFEETWLSFARPLKEKGSATVKTQYYMRLAPRGFYKARSTLSGLEQIMPDELPNNYSAVKEAYIKAIAKLREKAA